MKRVVTLHIPIYQGEKLVHITTIRNDWQESDYQELNRTFPGFKVRSTKSGYTMPGKYLYNSKWNHTDFQGMKKFAA